MSDVKFRPLQPGAGLGVPNGPIGTLGLLLKDASGARFGLSCSHVLARCGAADPGIVVEQPADPFVDPSFVAIGKLAEPFTTIQFGFGTNTEDLAVVRVDPSIACRAAFVDDGQIYRTAFDGDVKDMIGCSTVLHGTVHPSEPGSIRAQEKDPLMLVYRGFGLARFTGLVRYETACDEGDSGSAVTIADSDVVLGIHIGGTRRPRVGYFVPIAPFLAAHSFSLLTD